MKTKRVVIKTDGGAKPNPGPAAIGAVLKDEQGRVITNISQDIGQTTSNQAEYRALITALEKALRLGVSQVEVRSDSELLVKQINGQYRVKAAPIKPLYLRVKQLQSQFEGFRITHIPTEENREAHDLVSRILERNKATL